MGGTIRKASRPRTTPAVKKQTPIENAEMTRQSLDQAPHAAPQPLTRNASKRRSILNPFGIGLGAPAVGTESAPEILKDSPPSPPKQVRMHSRGYQTSLSLLLSHHEDCHWTGVR